MLEFVSSSVTTADIHKRYGGKLGAYKDNTFTCWLKVVLIRLC